MYKFIQPLLNRKYLQFVRITKLSLRRRLIDMAGVTVVENW